jgi:hypothetical protein
LELVNQKDTQDKSTQGEPYQEQQLCSYWNVQFKNSMVAKSEDTKAWQRYIDAYRGDYFKDASRPDYKSNQISNYIFSIVETIRPIMLDNDPKFMAVPRQPEGMEYSNDVQEAMLYEWDRESMSSKLYKELITLLVTGTMVFFNPWDSEDKNVRGIPVNPFNLFPDPLATTVEDAEYLIYATYKHEERLRRTFPKKADKLKGGGINYGELVHDNDKSGSRIDNQILVFEIHCKDWSMVEFEENGYVKQKRRYPRGRVITLCPEIGVVLSDRENPYKDGNFPFVLGKDYDIPGKFWGEGEVAQLISPQEYINELNNAIIDNAKHTANMPWIVDKNSGIGVGKITNRPGLVIRKNPGSEVKRDQPPSMPAYVQNSVETLKVDIEHISGVPNTIRGQSETGVYTAQGILALQEAGQTRIRLKVKLLEDTLGKLATMWYSRMCQYWKEGRFIRATRHDGSYDVKEFKYDSLQNGFDIKISAGSTMPVNRGAMLDLMIRLAQTPAEDGKPMVDREAVVQYLPAEAKSAIMKRAGQENATIAQIQEQVAQQEEVDNETMGIIEEVMGAIEKINGQILQLKQEHDKMKEDEKLNEQFKTKYNEGYSDAEKLLSSQPTESQPLESGEGGLPEEILAGLEELDDEQLRLIIEQNPEMIDLINKI